MPRTSRTSHFASAGEVDQVRTGFSWTAPAGISTLDRAAGRPAELVLIERRPFVPGAVLEEVVGVQRSCPLDWEARAVNPFYKTHIRREKSR
jgi:hypothetical protein